MNIFGVILCIAFCIIEVQSAVQYASCPMVGYRLVDPDDPSLPVENDDITTWGDCADNCWEKEDCAAWTLSPVDDAAVQWECRLYPESNDLTIYEESGNNTMTGSWECQDVDCGPVEVINGKMIGDSTRYRSSISFKCNEGYTLEGSDTASCEFEGWSVEAPQCQERRCDELDIPLYGQIVGDNLIGSVVTYSCLNGYVLEGRSTRACGEDGWTGNGPLCSLKDCGVPLATEFGSIAMINSFFGSEITYQCASGYELTGNNIRQCTMDGWSGMNPGCIDIDECASDEANDCNANAICFNTEGHYNCTCEVGYNGNGNFCELVSCGEPQNMGRWGSRVGTEFTYGKQVSYSCLENYELFNGATRTCTADGVWTSNTQPKCDVIRYKLTVVTSTANYAGTNSDIFATLHGEFGDCGDFHLDTENDDHERGDHDHYTFRCPAIGEVSSISINHEGSDGWQPEYIKIEHVNGGPTTTCYFDKQFENTVVTTDCSG